ncbi:MAG: hypothetical protein IMZ71_01645 [Chloroflexi bacterium]|nr:hypothetical protein [Chloroflexota bacterium]
MKSYKAGSPPKEPLQAGSATGCAPFKRHYSPIHGRQLNSWSEYRRANKELGLIDVGHKPELPHVEKLAETSAGYIAND